MDKAYVESILVGNNDIDNAAKCLCMYNAGSSEAGNKALKLQCEGKVKKKKEQKTSKKQNKKRIQT